MNAAAGQHRRTSRSSRLYHSRGHDTREPQPRHALSHPHLRAAAGIRRGRHRAPGRLGPSPARPRPADLPRPARPPRDHPGRHRQGRCARRPRDGQPGPLRVRRVGRGDGRAAAARDREHDAADRRDRAPDDRLRDPVRGEDAALLHQRARRAGRRDPAPQVPLSRHPPRADAAPAPAPQPDGPGDPRGPPRERLRRGRDADADQEHARGRPRLHRPEPPPAGHRLRPAAEPAAAQAAADGRRHRSLLPDRPVLSRRGPARRPPARVHPARPRDELRRRGDRHGLRRGDGDRGLAGDRPGPADPAGAVPGDDLRGGARAVRLGQAGRALRDGAGRPRTGARRSRTAWPASGFGVFDGALAAGGRVKGIVAPGHGRHHPARDRRADRAGAAVRRQGPGPPVARARRRDPRADRQVPVRRRRSARSSSAAGRRRAT